MSNNLEAPNGAIGDANDTTDLRPNVMFVETGGASTGHYYASVRMSSIPREGEQVRISGAIGVGVFVPDGRGSAGPGRQLARTAVLQGTVDSITWTLKGAPDDVLVEIALRDVTESDD